MAAASQLKEVEKLEKQMLDLMKKNNKDFPKELQEHVIESVHLFSFINSEQGGSSRATRTRKKERQEFANRIQSFLEEQGKAFYECCKKEKLGVKPIALGIQTLDVQNISAPSKEIPSTNEGDTGGRQPSSSTEGSTLESPSLEFGETHEKSFGGDASPSHSDLVGVESAEVIHGDKSIDTDDFYAIDFWGIYEEEEKVLEEHAHPPCFNPRLKNICALMTSRNKLLLEKCRINEMEVPTISKRKKPAGPTIFRGKESAGPTTISGGKNKISKEPCSTCTCSHMSQCLGKQCLCVRAGRKCKNSCSCRIRLCKNR